MSRTDQYNALLPQTQCTECGYSGCLPYAQALSTGVESNWTLCRPGGQEVSDRLTKAAELPPQIVAQSPESWTAYVDVESCIGCNLCMKICPVDAFIGALNYEHQVFEDDCTGCKLCLPVCPTQCITLQSRRLPLPTPEQNREHIQRKKSTQEAIKNYRMQNHHRSLANLLRGNSQSV